MQDYLLRLDNILIALIPAWKILPGEIKLKTYLQLYCLEKLNSVSETDEALSQEEMDVLRIAILYQSLGCVNTESKTCKLYIYSFLGAREMLLQLQQGHSFCQVQQRFTRE